MNRILATTLALSAALAPLAIPAAAQTSAANAAQQTAARATGAFERIDPDTDMPTADEAALAYAGLPPLEDAVPAPRGPAVRMIANPVVQPLPTPAASANNDPFVIKSILPIEGSIRYGDWFWDESAAPRTGKLVITVDLEARVISAFRDGHEIGTAVALLGTQKHPTPLGTFPILTKEKDNISEKYNNAPMPHTLRLTWDGIAIHGSPVLNGYASHGCVGVPDEFAAKLFAAAKRGDKVIITRGKMIGIGDKVL
jgi:lipoprotein-anchoring transpeptidase ErfK/SrfK